MRSSLRLFLAASVTATGLGIAAGLVASAAGARFVRAFVFQVEPLDPLRIAAVAGALLTIAVVVSLRPALRASRVDVARTLRDL